MEMYSLAAYNTDGPSMLMTVSELAEYLGIGRNKAYGLLREGDIKGFRIGSIWKVSQEAIDMYIREKSGMV